MKLSSLQDIFWPIHGKENKKFVPMALMMMCILFNYSMLRSIKDSFVVTSIGAEALSFLKTYAVLPSAVIAMILYVRACNVMSQDSIFYSVVAIFAAYLGLFAFIIYPHESWVHPNPESVERLAAAWPNFKWFIRVAGKWGFASFYVMAELWGSIMVSLLYWRFANKITTTSEAKRAYPIFGLVGNLGLILTGFLLGQSMDEGSGSNTLGFTPVITSTIASCIVIMVIYYWMVKNVVNDPELCPGEGGKSKKSKVKLSLVESFKMIFASKYLGLIAMLILCYGISINLIEGIWKDKVRALYPTKEGYARYMGQFQALQGAATIVFMLIGGNILRGVSWFTAAIMTPLMILITSVFFFLFVFFDTTISFYLAGIISTASPLAIGVAIGTWQNVLSKATKYSLFDSTKEMAYIPLDEESKNKGKAAVDIVGGRLGKSAGGIIQSSFFMLFHAFTFSQAAPYFAVFFIVVLIIWIICVNSLNKEYQNKISEQ